jgi:hypothetical protein
MLRRTEIDVAGARHLAGTRAQDRDVRMPPEEMQQAAITASVQADDDRRRKPGWQRGNDLEQPVGGSGRTADRHERCRQRSHGGEDR